jgi:hypothetical protein
MREIERVDMGSLFRCVVDVELSAASRSHCLTSGRLCRSFALLAVGLLLGLLVVCSGSAMVSGGFRGASTSWPSCSGTARSNSRAPHRHDPAERSGTSFHD